MLSGWCWSIGGSTVLSGAAICSIAEKFGCSSETLRKWVRRAETDQGLRPGLTSPDQLAELAQSLASGRCGSCGGRMRS